MSPNIVSLDEQYSSNMAGETQCPRKLLNTTSIHLNITHMLPDITVKRRNITKPAITKRRRIMLTWRGPTLFMLVNIPSTLLRPTLRSTVRNKVIVI